MNKTASLLIVDDQPNNLDVLVNYLADSGLELLVATEGEQAIDIARQCQPDVILLDVMMPKMDGIMACKLLKAGETTAHIPILFMSALTDVEKRLEAFQAGAIDFISKPLRREEVLARIKAHLTIAQQQQLLTEKNRELERLNADLQEQINKREQVEQALTLADERVSTLTKQDAERFGLDAFVGQSAATNELVAEVQSLQMAANTNVLVLGESGTGKELISRAIHYGSARKNKPFVAVNCSAIPMELADAEFFGHTKGAYTGATADRNGYFVQADGGTLFLDEIGDMPLILQAKLLRVLEDGLITPIGAKQSRKVDVRVVAATNINLQAKIQSNEFRQDLYFRLAGYQISLPPLRERKSDIALLIGHFLNLLGRQMGREHATISQQAVDQMCRYHYPGNVRELRNVIEYALIASRGAEITPQHLHFIEAPSAATRLAPTIQAPLVEATQSNHGVHHEVANSLASFAKNQEEQLLSFVASNGRIDNTSAQQVLNVDHGRASYLLKKLHKEGQLQKQGERRWSYYTLSNHK